jgi:cyclic dehypoxanthinyl futalosine synthase
LKPKKERLEHLIRLRQVQNEKPNGNYGFVTFVPWPFMDEETVLQQKGIRNTSTANDFDLVMMEENVVSAAGAKYKMNAQGIQQAIRDAGFETQ